ncbi:UNVERIFIED_CONTAM: hypothetical protein PYX00_008378 [Menopon gallinae]|uniref:Mitotic spindle assembly checkpoint protein MAD1 n=1 Tax=Menopon gallinae TaxID=328185 RepID=A0AAW2HN52_9NEOP
MSDKDRMSLPGDDVPGSCHKGAGERFSTNFARLSSTGSCVKGISFNSSSENNLPFKRKIDHDISYLDEKRRRDVTETSTCVSPWEFRRLRADLVEAQAQIVKLEDRIDELHKKNKETVIFFDKEKSEMKLQIESNRTTVKDLEYRLHKVKKREAECRQELSEYIKLSESEKAKLNEKLLQLERENNELKGKCDEVEISSQSSVTKFQEEIQNLKEENERLKLNLEEKTELCSNLEDRLSAALKAFNDADSVKDELHLLKIKLQELESEKAQFEESRRLTVVLSEKVLKLPEMEKELQAKRQEVANLRLSVHNKVVLEELIHDLKLKLSAVEEREKQIPPLKAKLAELEMELKKWHTLAADFGTEPTIDSLRWYIESLQEKELNASVETNNLNASIRSSETKLSTLQNELQNMKQIKEKLESSLQKLKVEVQVLRKKSILVTRERDSYRQQLDLYEKDLTMTGLSNENFNNEIFTQMKDRIKTLEESLEEYRKHVEVLENQLKECREEDPVDNLAEIRKLKEEVQNLEETNKFLSKIRDELERKLEIRALKGEYLSPDTKILHFRDNPLAEAQRKQKEDIASLQEECDRLRTRVQLLESGEVMDITQKVGENIQFLSSERVKELEKELESANLKMQRLKEVYRKTSQEFCDVSFMLLGYRIVLVSNNKLYKLYNMYSSSPSDYLMFQLTKNGTMEMLGTPFAESLSKLVDEHLHKGNSIPAFLAAVTLSLYSSNEQSEEDDDDDEPEQEEPPEEIELD